MYLVGGVILTYLIAWGFSRWMPTVRSMQRASIPLNGYPSNWECSPVLDEHINFVVRGRGSHLHSFRWYLFWSEEKQALTWSNELHDHFLLGDRMRPPVPGEYTGISMIDQRTGWPLFAFYSRMTMLDLSELAGVKPSSATISPSHQIYDRVRAGELKERRERDSLREMGLIARMRVMVVEQPQIPDVVLSIHPLWPGFIVNTFFWSSVLFALINTPRWIVKAIRNHRRARRGACLRCGYTLAGLPKCPECGTHVPSTTLSRSAAT